MIKGSSPFTAFKKLDIPGLLVSTVASLSLNPEGAALKYLLRSIHFTNKNHFGLLFWTA